jgi:NAD(P)H-dependent FMN reductase
LDILAISGSLRQASLNTRLLTALQQRAPAEVSIELATLHGIPLYNGDDEKLTGIPATVEQLRERIRAADALMLATPEYNAGMPGVLKNALDWLSRPPEVMAPTFAGKPLALCGATPGGLGTTLAQAGSLQVLRQFKLRLYTEHLRVSAAHKQLDEAGQADQSLADMLERWLRGFVEFVG